MHYAKDHKLEELFVELTRYTDDGPIWLHLNDANTSWGRAFHYRDAARLGWALLDAATAKGEPYPVKEGE